MRVPIFELVPDLFTPSIYDQGTKRVRVVRVASAEAMQRWLKSTGLVLGGVSFVTGPATGNCVLRYS